MIGVHQWRQGRGWTQREAAAWLGVSQPYLSLLEKGARPVTERLQARMAAGGAEGGDEASRRELAALGYPGFAHLEPSGRRRRPEDLFLEVLRRPEADARVAEAMVWLARRYGREMDWVWLVRQAKLYDLTNRVGFVLDAAGLETAAARAALVELERGRLLAEATLCWDAMPSATRGWMRENRSGRAAHWNIVTRVDLYDGE